MNAMNQWHEWDHVPIQGEQKKRYTSALKGENTPLVIDATNGTAIFQGREYQYETTLSYCTCPDFSKRSVPCKHMYRLAMELDAITGTPTQDLNAAKKKYVPDGIDCQQSNYELVNMPEETRNILRDFLYQYIYKDGYSIPIPFNEYSKILFDHYFLIYAPVQDLQALLLSFGRNELNERLVDHGVTDFKKNMSLEDLVAWIFENVPNPETLCTDRVIAELSDCRKKNIKKVYFYLSNGDPTVYEDEDDEVFTSPSAHTVSVNVDLTPTYLPMQKSKTTTLLLCIFLGFFGVHRFYVGKIGTGCIWLFTAGCCYIGWIADIISIASGKFTDSNGIPLS